jgi:hypothetical protein
VDVSKLPLSLLVALGLAPEACTTKDPNAHPCLNIAEPPIEKQAPDPKEQPVGPCLMVVAPDEVGPCLEVAEPPPDPPPPKEDPPVGPCLKVAAPDPPVGPCLSVPKSKAPRPEAKPKDASGGMASRSRSEVIERVRAELPEDVAARLRTDEA